MNGIEGAKFTDDHKTADAIKNSKANIGEFKNAFSKAWAASGETNPIFKGFKSVGKQALLGAVGGAGYTAYDRR